MFHFSFPPTRFNRLRAARWLTILGCVLLCLWATGSVAAAAEKGGEIVSVTAQDKGASLEIRISGSGQPTFTTYELFNPSRIILDLAETDLKAGFAPQLPQEYGVKLSTTKITDVSPPLLRFEFQLDQSTDFTSSQEGNDIVLVLGKGGESAEQPAASQADQGSVIQDVKVMTAPDKTIVRLVAGSKLTDFTYDVLARDGDTPDRLYIDINNTSGDLLLQEHQVGTSLARIRIAKRGSGLRFVFDSSLDQLFPFSISPVAQGLEVTIAESSKEDQVSSIIKQKSTIESQLPDVNPLDKQASAQDSAQMLKDAFNFSGYNKQRITVDYYKTDLHNVFRLFREVSGINIVVDEGVSGSLTLALDNVPWDFALDIILNLKGLQKEERFNTMVIMPQGKELYWPKQAENNVSFEADIEVVEKEALIIKQHENLPKEVIEAKNLIGQARKMEKRENFETAISLYEQAYVKWPDNSNLANKIASIYLVQLRQNAKAAFYAKKALAADQNNSAAALNAAIALANMQEKQQALEYFDQSVSQDPPSQEALLSYAVFSEEQKEYAGALKLLNKHDQIYGKNLNSMIATARIYDKQGDHETATEKYQSILYAGFRIPPDLAKFIENRIALKQSM